MADFCLVSRRALEELEYQIFHYHYLLGADWKLCCRQLKIEKGQFFHYVYDIERHLGRTFAELTPYALYPVAEYFSGGERRDMQAASSPERLRKTQSRVISSLPLSA